MAAGFRTTSALIAIACGSGCGDRQCEEQQCAEFVLSGFDSNDKLYTRCVTCRSSRYSSECVWELESDAGAPFYTCDDARHSDCDDRVVNAAFEFCEVRAPPE